MLRISVADLLLPTLGAALQEVQDPVAEGGVYPRVLILVMSFDGTMLLNVVLQHSVQAQRQVKQIRVYRI